MKKSVSGMRASQAQNNFTYSLQSVQNVPDVAAQVIGSHLPVF